MFSLVLCVETDNYPGRDHTIPMKQPLVLCHASVLRLSCIAFGLSTALSVEKSQAAVLASYQFTDDALSSSVANPPQYTLSNIGRGPGFTAAATTDATNDVYRIGGDAGTATSLAEALAENEYISFTITPAIGPGLQLQSLKFSQALVGSTGATINIGIALFSSVNGFADISDVVTGGHFQNTTNGVLSLTQREIDLSSLGAVTTPTEFRLYVYDNSGTNGRAHRIDDLVLEGSVIPEPSSVLSLGVAALFIAGRRRRCA